MKVVFTEAAWEDYLWFQTKNRRLLKRINDLIRDTTRTPFEGIGKPEPLKADLAGDRSRRIDAEHRVVYGVEADMVIIISCRFHYER